MTNVESIRPYIIVKNEDGFYGITDKKGNIIVPCIMDVITNTNYDEIGLELWSDFFCVLLIKNGKYGFFTTNGKFIEPAYENYTVDPCGGDIHVKTNNGYGVFAAPEYNFVEKSEQCSLLAEISGEDFDEGFED